MKFRLKYPFATPEFKIVVLIHSGHSCQYVRSLIELPNQRTYFDWMDTKHKFWVMSKLFLKQPPFRLKKFSKNSFKIGSNDVDSVCVRFWIVYNFVYKSNRFPRNVPKQFFLQIFSLNVNTTNLILAKNMLILYIFYG